MSALDLIARLRERGIRIAAIDGELELDAPRGQLTPELKAEILRNKTDLLRLLSWSRRSGRVAALPLVRADRQQRLPLSWAQQRLWFLDQLEPLSAAYNISWTVRLQGQLALPALEDALAQLIERHETLRTRFPDEDGVPYQHIDTRVDVPLTQSDVAGFGDEQLRARLAQLAGAPFDLQNGPLLRVHLLRVSDAEHILLVVIHHIVADGASMRVLFRELAALYEAQLSGRAAALPALPVQYADFSVWQRAWLDGEELDRQVEYWRAQLEGLPPLLELPWDRPRSAAMRYRGASVLRVLPAELAEELRALGRAHGCTLFMVMLAAFFVLLRRYTGRDDLAVGTPLGGRPRSDLEGLIGFFINTVVLRANLDGDPSFAQLLRSVRDIALEAHANQELPFEKLVEVLQPQRELSYSPVFQVMFDLQEEPRWKLPVRNLEVVPEVVFSSRTSSFDLTLSIRHAEHGLDAMFEYDTDLFDELTIERMAAQYQTLLEDLVARPNIAISRLRLLDEAAQQKIIADWGSISAPYPDQASLGFLFERQAALHPDRVAVVAGDIQCTYSELNRRVNRLVYRLQALGMGRGATVAIWAERSLDYVAALLAVLKSGAAAMPVDPAYPAARIAHMLAAADAQLVLNGTASTVPDNVTELRLTPELFTDPEFADQNPQLPVAARDVAVVLFTSGSTGQPKAVELGHRGLVNYVHHLGRKTGVSENDRVLQFAALSFDIALEEFFTALLHGAALVLRGQDASESVAAFTRLCAAEQVSWLSLPTAWWHELCTAGAAALPECVQTVIIGGERAQPAAFAAWRKDIGTRIRLFNTYGPTETSIAATWCELTHLDNSAGTELPIGHPVPNVRAWVLDEHLQPLPAGVPGELYIGGVGVAHGYRNEPGLTAEVFVADPFAAEPGARLYRTGDRARYLPDGQLVFIGRVDEQVKVRGHRVEPGEVEAALLAAGARSAVVLLVAERLVAWVVGEVRQAELRETLPEYMQPSAVVTLDELPLTPNGKLDKRALPAPTFMRSDEVAYVAPRTATEQELVEIWAAVLGIERIGVHDNFFALGGHSLLATRVVARVRDVLGRSLPLRALFNAPTIAGLAEQLAEASAAGDSIPLVPRTDTYALPPLSWAQQRLWFLDQLEPANPAYNLPWTARVRGRIDTHALQCAIDGLLLRHESLRTLFGERAGAPVQLIQTSVTVPVQAEQTSADQLDARLLELIRQPFDLSAGPLLRVHLLQLSADDAVLLLLVHHIVADGWSMGVLFRELAAFYAAHLQGETPQLLPLPLQYADYAVWQRQWLSGSELERQANYWRGKLEGAPALLELPLDHPRPAVQSYRGDWVSQDIPPDIVAGLRELAQREGCTMFMVLLAAFKLLLARYTGVEDLLVGTPIAGRRRTELEGLIGCFLNTLALRTDLSGNPSFDTLLQRVKATTLDAYEHQELPFEKLLEMLQPERSTAHSPLVQILFNLHNAPAEQLALEGLAVQPFSLERGTAKFDLSVALAENGAGLQAGFEYNTDLFTRATIEEFAGRYTELLAALVDNPAQRVADLPAAVPLQSAPVIAAEQTLVAAVAATVNRCGDRPAVDDGTTLLSYSELGRRANAVAHALLSELAPGSVVGLLLGHDVTMLVGLLGALKAGCAWVPLDPDAPAERLRTIMAEAGVSAVVSDPRFVERLAGVPVVAVTDEQRADAPAVTVTAADLAYILFTSGSTGTPKGVMQTQGNALYHARTYIESLQISPDDRLSLLANFGFDAALMDIFGALLSGACLVPIDLKRETEPAARLAAITVFHATPTVFRWLHEDSSRMAGYRAVVLGGERARSADFELFKKVCKPGAVFVNGLGPSESTLALQFFADHSTRLPGNAVPVGRPVAGCAVMLLDEAGNAAGLTGELAIRSRFVSIGYCNQPELTAERFVPQEDGTVLYKSGDRVRYWPDGQLLFLGRIDEQIKLRGHRIEPGEVEAAVIAAGADACVVLVHAERLVAYVVGDVAANNLRDQLREVLPDYMLPASFVLLDSLPRTPNGKLDKRALPAPPLSRDDGQAFVAPRSSVEQQLTDIWAEVLGTARLSVHDDFFALGGHSLMATRVVARVRDSFGIALPLRALFAQPTVAGLATLLQEQRIEDSSVPLLPRAQTGELPPLSWAQQRLWFLDQLEPESAAYNLHWAARLNGHLKVAALARAVNALVARHESLRTRFVRHENEPVQLILNELAVTVKSETLPGAGEERIHARLLELIREPFDLQTGPLLRVHLLRLADDEAVLLLTVHHIVADGWSMGVLFRELAALYDAEVQQHPAALPELRVQYADYAMWQRQWLSGMELKRQVDYWMQQLNGAPSLLELPLDHARPPVQRYRGAWVNQTFSPELLEGLRELAGREGCTLFMVLLAAFKVLLARYTGVEDIVVGTPIAGRKRTELEGLIGFFLNTLALRTDLGGNPQFAELLQRVKATTLDAYEHQELPFEKLLEVLQPVRSTAHTPVVQVMFNLHNEPSSGLSLAGLAVSPFSVDRGTSKFDLSVALIEGSSGLQAGFEYNTDLFERETVELLLRHFGELLWAVARNDQINIAAIPFTSAASSPRPKAGELLRPAGKTLVAAFAQVVAQCGDNPAVVTATESVSYAELDRHANGVAWQLHDYRGARVGLLLGHDASMLAGLLGTLKAGCAYVPLDPDAPPARLQAIIADAGIAVVVTEPRFSALLDGVQCLNISVLGRDEAPPLAPVPEDLAYILFTSGSTGTPKGVMQNHRNVLHHARTYIEALQITSHDRLTLLSHFGFDAAVMDIFGALLSGACLYPLELRDEQYTGETLDKIGEHRLTLLHSTPTVFRHLMRNKVCRHDLTCVRAVVLGGEEALATDFASFRRQFAPPTLFVNGLGPSESTLALQFFAEHDTRLPGNVVPVGRPVPGCNVVLLDDQGKEAGISGELCIRSRYVSTGYWRQPELTAERFVPQNDGTVLYKTGDRARYLPDGRLVFIGRTDDQVKVRGHRIEPGEVETAVVAAGAERCAVILADDRLVAYVVGDIEAARLRVALQDTLPDYMVPSAYVFIDELPLLANGKLDKKALPRPALTRDEGQVYVAPRNDVEQRLVQIWSEVLGVERIGVHDDFFALGGHSLLAAQLVARVTDSLQVGLPIRRLFDAPTVAGIAEHVEALQWALRTDALRE